MMKLTLITKAKKYVNFLDVCMGFKRKEEWIWILYSIVSKEGKK